MRIWSLTPQFVCTACTKKPNSYVYLEPDTTIGNFGRQNNDIYTHYMSTTVY